jgi:hypothetical protein
MLRLTHFNYRKVVTTPCGSELEDSVGSIRNRLSLQGRLANALWQVLNRNTAPDLGLRSRSTLDGIMRLQEERDGKNFSQNSFAVRRSRDDVGSDCAFTAIGAGSDCGHRRSGCRCLWRSRPERQSHRNQSGAAGAGIEHDDRLPGKLQIC